MPKSVVSIDSLISSDDSGDEEYQLAQQEWEESLEQLAQIVSVVLFPFLGKWLGRRWSYWGENISLYPTRTCSLRELSAYARYVRLGLGKSFFIGERPTSSS